MYGARSLRNRGLRAAVALVLAVALLVMVPRTAEALVPALAPVTLSGGTMVTGAGVAVGTGGVVVLGVAGYYGYRYYMDHHHLDTTVGGAGATYCGFPTTTVYTSMCMTLQGVQNGRYVMQIHGSFENPHTTAKEVRLNTARILVNGGGCSGSTGVLTGGTAVGGGDGVYSLSGYIIASPSLCRTDPLPNYIMPEKVDLSLVDPGCVSCTRTHSFTYTFQPSDNQSEGPQRTVTAEVECINAAGNVVTVTEVSPPQVVHSGGMLLDAPAVQCPSGYAMRGLTVYSDPAAGSSGERIAIQDWSLGLDPAMLERYAECFFAPSGNPCGLQPYRKVGDPLTVPLPNPLSVDPPAELNPQEWDACELLLENCVDWWTRGDRDERFGCGWGPWIFPARECRSLAWYYQPGSPGHVAPNPNTQPPGSTSTEPTTTDPSAHTAPAPAPSTGTSTEPTTTTTLPDPTPSEAHGDTSCWSNLEVGWNPVSWVLEPVKCALQWAFVPSQATVTQLQSVPDLFAGKAPVSTIVAVKDYVDALAVSGGGCILWELTIYGEGYAFVDSCTPDAVSGWIMARRAQAAFIVWGSLLIPLGWWAWRQYAPGSQGVA